MFRRRRDRGTDPPPLTDPDQIRLWSHKDAPDRSQFRRSAEHYYREYVDTWAAKDEHSRRHPGQITREGTELYGKQVLATWGLLARGDEALPYALELARSKDSEFREAGSYLLGQLRKNPEVVRVLLAQLAQETDDVARDTTVLALGDLRDKRAIPALAGIIRDEGADGDTRHTAAEALGKIVRKRFGGQGGDVIADALAWLDQDSS